MNTLISHMHTLWYQNEISRGVVTTIYSIASLGLKVWKFRGLVIKSMWQNNYVNNTRLVAPSRFIYAFTEVISTHTPPPHPLPPIWRILEFVTDIVRKYNTNTHIPIHNKHTHARTHIHTYIHTHTLLRKSSNPKDLGIKMGVPKVLVSTLKVQ